MTTERKEIQKNIGPEVDFNTHTHGDGMQSIDNFIEWLQGKKEEGATHLEFSATAYSDGSIDEINIQPVMIYTETKK